MKIIFAPWSILILLIFFLSTTRSSMADEYHLRLSVSKKEQIPEIKWQESNDTQEPALLIRDNADTGLHPYYVKLNGTFQKVGSSLLYKDQPLPLGSKGEFSIEVEIYSARQEFTLKEINALGNLQTQAGELEFPQWEQFTVSLTAPPSVKKWSLTPGLGVTVVSYEQSGISQVSEGLLSLKVSGDYKIFDLWDIAGNLSVAALPLVLNSNKVIQFFYMNMQMGFSLPQIKDPWGLTFYGGLYYSTTFSNAGFGYSNFTGPTLSPTVKRRFTQDTSSWFYVKYAAIVDELSILELGNSEFSLGGGYTFPITLFKRKSVFSASLDISLLNLRIEGGGFARSNTYTFGIGYKF